MAEVRSPPTLPWRVITHCKLYKGSNRTGLDLETGEIVPLFHPRRDVWIIHFALGEAMMSDEHR
jgi:hypothetical protein